MNGSAKKKDSLKDRIAKPKKTETKVLGDRTNQNVRTIKEDFDLFWGETEFPPGWTGYKTMRGKTFRGHVDNISFCEKAKGKKYHIQFDVGTYQDLSVGQMRSQMKSCK